MLLVHVNYLLGNKSINLFAIKHSPLSQTAG